MHISLDWGWMYPSFAETVQEEIARVKKATFAEADRLKQEIAAAR